MMRNVYDCYCPECGDLIETCHNLNDDLYCLDCGWNGLAYEADYITKYEEYNENLHGIQVVHILEMI